MRVSVYLNTASKQAREPFLASSAHYFDVLDLMEVVRIADNGWQARHVDCSSHYRSCVEHLEK